MTAFARLVLNEIEKLWRGRWIVFAGLFGLLALVAIGLYIFYVAHDHRWAPPPPTPWQVQLQQTKASDQETVTTLERAKRENPGTSAGRGGFGGAFSIDTAIASAKQSVKDDQYLLDNGIAPLSSFSITMAVIFGMGGILMFLLTRIFAWLSSEQLAGERSNRTMSVLLSRPPSRNQVLAAKSVAAFLLSFAVVIATFLVAYGVMSFIFGSAGPVTDQVGIAIDGTQPLGPGNVTVMPIPLFLLMSLGAVMLSILCVQGMGLLISVLSGRSAIAIGITLALLFGAPILSAIASGIIILIAGDAHAADALGYLFINDLSPVGALARSAGSTSSGAQGMNEFRHEIAVLAVWTVAFFAATWFLFHRREEPG